MNEVWILAGISRQSLHILLGRSSTPRAWLERRTGEEVVDVRDFRSMRSSNKNH